MIHSAPTSQGYRWKVARQCLVIFLVATALLGVTAVAHYYVSVRAERVEHETSELLNVELGKTAIASNLKNVTSDLMFLARHNELQGMFDSADSNSQDMLARQFQVFMGQKGIYDQIRFLDQNGMEIVRVNYNNGDPMIVPEDELQNKGQRYYFRQTWALLTGEVYISPLDLNVEHGQIDQPPKPMIRFATPVIDRGGNRRGVLLLNYFGDKLIGDFKQAAANISDHVMLLNADGFWLSSSRPEDEWGFMYNNDRTFAKAYPDAWAQIQAQSSGQFRDETGMYSFTTVYPALYAKGSRWAKGKIGAPALEKSYYWKVVSLLSSQLLSRAPGNFVQRNAPLYLAMLGLLAMASLLLAQLSVRHRQTTAQLEFERRFREILEDVDLLAVGLDKQGNVAFCNDALLALLAETREDIIGRNWFETFIRATEREHSQRMFRQIISRDVAPARHESKIQIRDGECRLISWNGTLLFDPQGQVIGLTYIGEDVTEARRSEEQLRKLSRAVEQSPSTVMITNTEGKIEYVNPKFTQLTGYTLEEMRGKNPRTLKSGETTAAEYQRLWRTITAGGEWRGVLHNKKKNGELYWEATCISPIRNAHGEITHFLGVKEDITERIHLEERFRRVVESAPNAIVMVNQEGKIVLVNAQTENLFGYAREELIGQPVEMLVPARLRAAHSDYRTGVFGERYARPMGSGPDLYGLRKDGSEFPVEIGLSPIDSDEGKLVLSAIVDITQRKRLEKELEARNREIAKTQALAVVGRMASMVAHDLRNPLSSIKVGLQILGKQPAHDWGTEEHELKQIALEQVRYMEVILSDLLRYSRPDALKPEWLDINKLLDTSVLLAQKHIAEHQVTVKNWHQSGLPTMHGDADRLRQAFSNIIINALQATEGISGRRPQVSITTHLELGEDRPRIRVEICDNGCGIKPQEEDNVFEPFFTTRAKGTGLGLAIVKRIIDQHHGSVELRPASKNGTCVVVILPTGPVDTDSAPAQADGARGSRPVQAAEPSSASAGES
jgi:nitrogen fixation negative regulator NifL